MKLIAELKKLSRSKGNLGENIDVPFLVSEYDRLGASVISIVTAEAQAGKLSWVTEARKITKLPILRRDSITTVDDVKRSKDAGADWVTCEADGLKMSQLETVLHACLWEGITPVVSARSTQGLTKIVRVDPNHAMIDCYGINKMSNPDLLVTATSYLPDKFVMIAAHNISKFKVIEFLKDKGYDYVVVGVPLMKSTNLEETFNALGFSSKRREFTKISTGLTDLTVKN